MDVPPIIIEHILIADCIVYLQAFAAALITESQCFLAGRLEHLRRLEKKRNGGMVQLLVSHLLDMKVKLLIISRIIGWDNPLDTEKPVVKIGLDPCLNL